MTNLRVWLSDWKTKKDVENLTESFEITWEGHSPVDEA